MIFNITLSFKYMHIYISIYINLFKWCWSQFASHEYIWRCIKFFYRSKEFWEMFLKVSDHFMNLFSSPKALNLLILWRKGTPQISGGRAIFLHRRSVDKWDFLEQNVALILLEISQKIKPVITSETRKEKNSKIYVQSSV